MDSILNLNDPIVKSCGDGIFIGAILGILIVLIYYVFFSKNEEINEENIKNDNFINVCNKKDHQMAQYVKIYNKNDINPARIERIRSNQLSKNYYEINEVCPELNLIYDNLSTIRHEVNSIKDEVWSEWPEKNLYENSTSIWNIYPFTAFGVVVTSNCQKCPTLWNFLQQLPGLRVAILSRLGPKTKLNTHQGWGQHSNNVIRCHFGFDVPQGCYVSVRENLTDPEEIKYQKQNEWILFDDSRHHYAFNPTNKERIILIVDIERPNTIKKGTSTVCDTKELMQIVDYFRKTNKL